MNPSLPAAALAALVAITLAAPPQPSAAAVGDAAKAPAGAAKKTPPRKVAADPARPPATEELPLTEAELDLSNSVLIGDVDCDMKQQVRLWPILSRPGHFELRFGPATYTLVPRETTTGAVRLEDAKAGIVWLQIPAKSMLLDARHGRRLADGCLHAAQRYEQADAAAAPAAVGLGIRELQR